MSDELKDVQPDSKPMKVLKTVAKYAKIVWEIPAIKSKALTWLIRIGVPGAPVVLSIIDALWAA